MVRAMQRVKSSGRSEEACSCYTAADKTTRDCGRSLSVKAGGVKGRRKRPSASSDPERQRVCRTEAPLDSSSSNSNSNRRSRRNALHRGVRLA
ncbi:hypothetical protein IG631_19417 [Alternaria alternata]|nr:hypothetical protein IG631_19417 [Alternaria alternata]